MNKKIKTTDSDLTVEKSHAMIVSVGNFKFVKVEGFPLVEIYLQESEANEANEFTECANVDEVNTIVNFKDLEIFALNWVFKNVEIVKEIKEKEAAQEVPVQEQASININKLRITKGVKPISNGDTEFIVLKQEIEKAAKNASKKEVLIGINPESYLGVEILKQSKEIIKQYYQIKELKNEINQLKEMTAEIINRLDSKTGK